MAKRNILRISDEGNRVSGGSQLTVSEIQLIVEQACRSIGLAGIPPMDKDAVAILWEVVGLSFGAGFGVGIRKQKRKHSMMS